MKQFLYHMFMPPALKPGASAKLRVSAAALMYAAVAALLIQDREKRTNSTSLASAYNAGLADAQQAYDLKAYHRGVLDGRLQMGEAIKKMDPSTEANFEVALQDLSLGDEANNLI